MTLPRPFRDIHGKPNHLYEEISAMDERYRTLKRKGSVTIEIHYDDFGYPRKTWIQERKEYLLDPPKSIE